MFRWAYIFLMGNLCLLIMNLPFSLASLILAIDVRNLAVFLFALLFFGPGMIALLAVINELKEEKDVAPVHFFFQSVKKFGARGLFYWLAGWFGTVVALSDILFFSKLSNGKWLIPFFLLALVLAIAFSINCWYFQIRNPENGIKDVARLAFYCTVKKWYFSILNVVLLLIILVLMILKPQFGFILTPSILAGLIYLNAGQFFREKVQEEK